MIKYLLFLLLVSSSLTAQTVIPPTTTVEQLSNMPLGSTVRFIKSTKDTVDLMLDFCGAAVITKTIFTTQVPTGATENDRSVITLGVQFKSSITTTVIGMRFYKTSGNNGTHVGTLWVDGVKLATQTFAGETSTGWQNVIFPNPVTITANTIYTAAYYSPNGTYTSTQRFFNTPFVNGTLTAIAGVYTYSNAKPTQSYNGSNYWVDVITK